MKGGPTCTTPNDSDMFHPKYLTTRYGYRADPNHVVSNYLHGSV